MEKFKTTGKKYFELLKARSQRSRVYKPHQQTGLILADLLDDPKHKSLYMRLSKFFDNSDLIRLARSLADRRSIQNKGAYFMKMLKNSDIKRQTS